MVLLWLASCRTALNRLVVIHGPEMAVGGTIPDPFPPHLQWPFGRLDSLNHDEVRSSAYEIFFTACRSTCAVAGDNHEGQGTKAAWAATKNMVATSRLQCSLGLWARKTRSRPMTSAEIMRRQMGASEHTDGLVRKTLAHCLVGPQMPTKVESLMLPMEFLRRLKASEFADARGNSSDSSSSWRQASRLYC